MSPLRHLGTRATTTVIACLAAAALTACSSSAAGPAGSTTPRAAGNTAGAPGSKHPIDVCATVDAASAAKLSGQPITTADTQSGLQPQEYGCVYGNDDDSIQVEITVYEHDAASTYDTLSTGSTGATPVSGLGDKAFFDDGTLYVLVGSNLIQVNGLDTADQSTALAQPVLAAL